MENKSLIKVMIASFMTALVLSTTTGCNNSEVSYGDEFKEHNDIYIVIENKQEKVLHKGDVVPLHCGRRDFKSGTGFSKINLDCSKEYITNAHCYLYENKPVKNEDYDEVCEDCFLLEKND